MRVVQLKDRGIELRLETEPFASGGEGGLYFIKQPFSYRKFVAKIYHPHKRQKEREEKIEYLVARPPSFEKDKEEIVVWPEEVILENGAFVGFIMPLIKGKKLEVLCAPRLPRKLGSEWQHFARNAEGSLDARLQVCYRLAEAVHRVHETNNYVLVDLKPDNVMLKPNGHIALVDMDSVEVVENGKALYSAPVATPEYTPPEYYRREAVPGETLVPESWDLFSLAAIFYKLLLGIHPYAASAKPPLDVLTTLEKKIEAGLFVHANAKQGLFNVIPPPHRDFQRLPDGLRQLFVLCFEVGDELVDLRPTALDWTLALRGEKALALQRSIPSIEFRPPNWEWSAAPTINLQLPQINWNSAPAQVSTALLTLPRSRWLYRKNLYLLSSYAMGVVFVFVSSALQIEAYHYLLFSRWPLPLQVLLIALVGFVFLLFVLTRSNTLLQYLAYRWRTYRSSNKSSLLQEQRQALQKRFDEIKQLQHIGQQVVEGEYQKIWGDWEQLLASYRAKIRELDEQAIRLLREERRSLEQEVKERLPKQPFLEGLSGSSPAERLKSLQKRFQKATQQIEENLAQKAVCQRYEGASLAAKKRQVKRFYEQNIERIALADFHAGKALSRDLQAQWDALQAQRQQWKLQKQEEVAQAFQRALKKRKRRFRPTAVRRFQRLSISGQKRSLKRRLRARLRQFLQETAVNSGHQQYENLRKALVALTERKTVGGRPRGAHAAQWVVQQVEAFKQAASEAVVEEMIAQIPARRFSDTRIALRKAVYEQMKLLENSMDESASSLQQASRLEDIRPDWRRALLQYKPSRLFARGQDAAAQQLEQELNKLRAYTHQVCRSIRIHGKEAEAWHKRFETWFYPWYQQQAQQKQAQQLAAIRKEEAACLADYKKYLRQPTVQAERLAKEFKALEKAYAQRDKALDALQEERLHAEEALAAWEEGRENWLGSQQANFSERHDALLEQGAKLRAQFADRFEALQKRVKNLPLLQQADMTKALGQQPKEVLAELDQKAAELQELRQSQALLDSNGKPLSMKDYKEMVKNTMPFTVY